MTRTWRYEPEALAEVSSVADYYEKQRKGLGDDFYDALEQTLDRLSDEPEGATPHPHAPREEGLFRHLMRRFLYAIVFYVEAQEVRVVAVSHVRREPLYWLERVPRR